MILFVCSCTADVLSPLYVALFVPCLFRHAHFDVCGFFCVFFLNLVTLWELENTFLHKGNFVNQILVNYS